jgi:phosphate/sulfate permease
VLGEIALAWIISPVASGLLTFFLLFFMKNMFGLNVGSKAEAGAAGSSMTKDAALYGQADISELMKYVLFGLVIFGIATFIFYTVLETKKRRGIHKSEEKFWRNMK